MRILLAAPNRDLLQCYQKIVTEDFGETVTAFDGAQVLNSLAEGRFDIAVVDCALPRVSHESILRQLGREDIPVIALLDEPVSVRLLVGEPLANAYLSFPFLPEELREAVKDVMRKKACQETLPFANTGLEISDFRLRCGAALTAGETDALRALLSGEALMSDVSGVYVNALNHKFVKYHVKARIKYESGKGFRMVTEDE